MQKIDMGGFENQAIEVEFAGKVYVIMADLPIEGYRMFLELNKFKKMDSDEAIEKYKDFVTAIICHYNKDVDKKEFKEKLTSIAAVTFINQYDKILAGDLKKEPESQSKNQEENLNQNQ